MSTLNPEMEALLGLPEFDPEMEALLGLPEFDPEMEALLGLPPGLPRFVIFSSYGNDSVALIQWAHEQGLRDVVVVYSDTGWASRTWASRVRALEHWVWSLGFRTARTSSIGFVDLAREKRGFPTQMFQWCSYRLKIEPGERWLDENDPDGRAVCLVGVRREEGVDRANFPIFNLNSNSHRGRVMVAPMAEWSEETRNAFLARAGVKPLPHRSMECFPCINSNKNDLRLLATDEARVAEIEALEDEMGINGPLSRNGRIRGALFRPSRHLGAIGIREVVKWAQAPRAQYKAPPPDARFADKTISPDPIDELDAQPGCEAGWCGI